MPSAVRIRWHSLLGSRPLGWGLVAEKGQAVGVEGHGKAHADEHGTEVLGVRFFADFWEQGLEGSTASPIGSPE